MHAHTTHSRTRAQRDPSHRAAAPNSSIFCRSLAPPIVAASCRDRGCRSLRLGRDNLWRREPVALVHHLAVVDQQDRILPHPTRIEDPWRLLLEQRRLIREDDRLPRRTAVARALQEACDARLGRRVSSLVSAR